MPKMNVKIVATIGPSSSSRDVIGQLISAGCNVFRLNMSHGNKDVLREVVQIIRSVESEQNQSIGILGDLQGPKLRCGTFAGGGAEITAGQRFHLDLVDEPGNGDRVQLPHPEIFAALQPGLDLSVNDGLLRLRVIECGPDYADCTVVVGGRISDRKGVNIPGAILPISPLSAKDRADLEFLCELGVDWIALSFVQKPEDVLEAKALIKGRAKLVSKIEKPSAIEYFDDILAVSDGIMVARGDLGVELPLQDLPPLQKLLVRKCRLAAKPVIVATQMLESMVNAPVPTRAEVSDVATAIYEGADAIMLSAETAAGRYPVEAVTTMVAVAAKVESDEGYREGLTRMVFDAHHFGHTSPLTIAAREIAASGQVSAICCFTKSGATAISQSAERPQVPIIALTPDAETARRLALVWGITPKIVPNITQFKQAVLAAIESISALSVETFAPSIAVTAGLPIHKTGTTNILRLAALDGSDMADMD